jgi:hypothetical protein
LAARCRRSAGGVPLLNSLRDDPILGPAYEYWKSKCGGQAMPRRRDIDPTEIPRLLPHLQITEFVDGGKRIRYRLAGTAVVDAYGGELKGKYFDEVFSGERLKFVEANYRVMCENKRPVLIRNRYFSPNKVPQCVLNMRAKPTNGRDNGSAPTPIPTSSRGTVRSSTSS